MYIEYNENPRGRWYANDCVIRAISIVTGENWESIYAGLCVEGFSIGDWGNINAVWDTYLRKRGFKRYIIPDTCPYCYTVEQFAKDHPQGSYILGTGRHAIAVVSGNHIDAWDSGREIPIYYYEMRS